MLAENLQSMAIAPKSVVSKATPTLNNPLRATIDEEPPASVICLSPAETQQVGLWTTCFGTFLTAILDWKVHAANNQRTQDTLWILRPQHGGKWALESLRRTYLKADAETSSAGQKSMVDGSALFTIILLGCNDTIMIRSAKHGTFLCAYSKDYMGMDRRWDYDGSRPTRFRVFLNGDTLLPQPQFPFPRHRVLLRHGATKTVLGISSHNPHQVALYDATTNWVTNKSCQWTLLPNDPWYNAFHLKSSNGMWLKIGTNSVTMDATNQDPATHLWVILLEAPSKVSLSFAGERLSYLSVRDTMANGTQSSESGHQVVTRNEIEPTSQSETFEFVVVPE
ncbi:hypothetical protein AMAG_17711 [Allomyces macrogynus ATCC 38327]|uniref:Fascin domain-containing protein n=1 Tax=Allomyces macrogynus (strain ATCC 38327) TaxID=578462 RepID=A0A0L0RXJ5_ALLM3|nr:hypothetical protein AMAG_17711 [Allomyces macrogynus ATCC 38327]|eukprot:KNE54849.1 hypothetical protein AMAG_17711 [Allomyces macrogynus ATCC 38327]